MAGFVSSVTQGQASPAVSVWTVNIPAGNAGESQALFLSYKDKSFIVGTIAGWQIVDNIQHSTGPASLAIFQRKLTTTVAASTINVGFGGAVQGSYICQGVDGDFESITAKVERNGTAEVTLPNFTALAANTAVIEVWASGEWPRVFPTNSGVPVVHQSALSGPGLTIGKRVVAAGTTTGTTFVPDDPNFNSTDTTFDGNTDWGPTIGAAVLFKTAAVAGGAADVVGIPESGVFNGMGSKQMTIPAGIAGDTQFLAINFGPTSLYGISTPAGWTLVDASRIDSYHGRLVLYERKLTSTTPLSTVVVSFTPIGAAAATGSWGAITARGTRYDVQRNDATQDVFSRSWSVPSVAFNADGVAISFIGSANFKRLANPSSDVTELLDTGWTPSLTVGKKFGSSGTSSGLGNWTPVDADNASLDGGDAYRAITVSVTPVAGTIPSGSVTATVSGAMAYVPAPGRPTFSLITPNSALATWQDMASDETAYWYAYRREQETSFSNYTTLAANFNTWNITGLSSGQRYRFIVMAQRGSDYSAWSEEGIFNTLSTITQVTLGKLPANPIEDATITVTAQTLPVEAGSYVDWTITGHTTLLNKAVQTDNLGRATLQFIRDTPGPVIVTASIGGKLGTITINVAVAVEALVLSVSPAHIERGYVATARVTGDFGGQFWLGKTVSLTSSNTNVVGEPAPAVMPPTYSNGSEWNFALPGINNGTTTLTAFIDGVASNSVDVVVADPAGPPVYTAGVATHCAIHIEAPLAVAIRPMIRRMTHGDQQFYYPGDDGYKFAASIANKEVTFFTKERIAMANAQKRK